METRAAGTEVRQRQAVSSPKGTRVLLKRKLERERATHARMLGLCLRTLGSFSGRPYHL